MKVHRVPTKKEIIMYAVALNKHEQRVQTLCSSKKLVHERAVELKKLQHQWDRYCNKYHFVQLKIGKDIFLRVKVSS